MIATCKGKALELLEFRHPFYDRNSPVYLGDYVTLETGTGLVHSAPAYGVEDFISCRAHGITDDQILNPVMGDGRFASSLPLFGGLSIWEANPKIVEHMKANGTLLKVAEAHPQLHALLAPQDADHLPRHQPVVRRHGRRSRMQGDSLRERALAGIEATAFYPGWGKARLHCDDRQPPRLDPSRQRQWGTPMAFFLHRETGELHPRTQELLEAVAQRGREGGIEVWQSLDPRGTARRRSRHSTRRARTRSTSGSTPARRTRPCCAARTRPIRSSRPTSTSKAPTSTAAGSTRRCWSRCMLNGVPPYKALLTHGFVVDGQGRKMSKSLGNGIEPQEVSDKLGAEILRLWVASSDYSGEITHLRRDPQARRRIVPAHPQHPALPARQRRRLRHRHAMRCRSTRMLEIDRYALVMTRKLQEQIDALYLRYEFHPVVSALQSFCSEDLGAFYLDILKDRLYTTRSDGHAAAQRADRAVAHHRCAAQADGADPVVHRRRGLGDLRADRHSTTRAGRSRPQVFHRFDEVADAAALDARWTADPRSARGGAQGTRERCANAATSARRCRPRWWSRRPRERFEALQSLGDDLRFVLITSAARRGRAPRAPTPRRSR